MRIELKREILGDNDRTAAATRRRLDEAGIIAVNLMSSPGAGKTTLLERTVVSPRLRAGIIAGDLQTSLDAERLRALGRPAAQVNTDGGCHLTAAQVAAALDELPLDALDLLFVENVGNLVCPAAFALGEHRRVALLSLPEGEDKPLKYPRLFLEADAILITKIDLEGKLPCGADRLAAACRRVNPDARLFPLSALTGAGLDAWLDWLDDERRRQRG